MTNIISSFFGEKGFDELHDEIKAFANKIDLAIQKGTAEHTLEEKKIQAAQARQVVIDGKLAFLKKAKASFS